MKKKRKIKVNTSRKKSKSTPNKSAFLEVLLRVRNSLWRQIDLRNEMKWKVVFYSISIIFLVSMILLGSEVGINGDDDVQVSYSEDLLLFYESFGENESAFENTGLHDGTMHLYGGWFEIISGGLNQLFGNSPDQVEYHTLRHILISLCGFFVIFFCSNIARLAGGYFEATLAMVFLFLSPRFLGHSLMNPKDIPFALGYCMSIYYMLIFIRQLPRPKAVPIILSAIGLGIALGIRVGGLLSFAYAALFMAVQYVFNNLDNKSVDVRQFLIYLRTFVIVSFVGFCLALAFWPYALVDPFGHIPEALKVFSDYIINIKVLFSGSMVWSGDIPIEYLTKWMFIGTPVFILLGLIIFFVFLKGVFNKYSTFPLGSLIFAFFFPIVYALAKGSALYDGMRHFLFAYVMGVTLAAVGWSYLLGKLASLNKKILYVGVAVLGLLMLDPAVFIARNSAYPYVYFNPLSGGINHAFGNYELDYWGVSVRQGVEWMEKEGIFDIPDGEQIVITSNFPDPISIYAKPYIDAGKLKVTYSRYRERYSNNWDYGIFVCRFMDGAYIRAGSWPTSESIHDITVNGKAISSIYKSSPEDYAYSGVSAARSGDLQRAVSLLQQEVAVHPDNEIAWQELSAAYLNLNQLPAAKEALDNTLQLNPDDLSGNNNLGLYYLRQNNAPEAIRSFEKGISINPQNTTALYYLAIIYKNQNNLNLAVDYAKKAVESNPRFKGAYQLTADIYTQMGNPSMAEAYLNAMNNSN